MTWHLIIDHVDTQLMLCPAPLTQSQDVVLDTFTTYQEATDACADLESLGAIRHVGTVDPIIPEDDKVFRHTPIVQSLIRRLKGE